jgi:hypothetical protein
MSQTATIRRYDLPHSPDDVYELRITPGTSSDDRSHFIILTRQELNKLLEQGLDALAGSGVLTWQNYK